MNRVAKSSKLPILLRCALWILTASPLFGQIALPNATIGKAYVIEITWQDASGTPPWTYWVSGGSVPPGLTVSSSGIISGTPTASGAYAFTLTIADTVRTRASQLFTLLVTTSPLTVTTATPLPVGAPGWTYPSTTLAASGGTGQGYTWSVTGGRLPAGLTLSSAGVLSGTLSSLAATSTFTVQVQDSGGNTATQQFTLTVTTYLTISTQSLPSGTPGAAYPSTTLVASGGTGQDYTWSLTLTGQLPVGLTLSSGGVLSGTLSSSATSSTFTVQVQDSGGNKATQQFTLTVYSQLTITTASLPNGAPGAQYTFTTAASGGTGQGYTWSVTVGQLPSGLTLSSLGILSGTLASSATSSTFTIQVQDSGGNTATRQFAITLGSVLAIATASLPNGTPGAQYTSATLAATGGTGQGYTWSVTAGQLPSGLALSSAGVLSGTLASSAASSTFTIQVQDSGGNKATQQFTITVSSQLSSQLTIITASLPNGMAGAQYAYTTLAATGGTGQGYTWSVTVGQLPSGLTLSPAGVLSGILSSPAAIWTCTIQVQDSAGNKAARQFTITVYSQLIITMATLPSGTPGAQYAYTTLAASGGTGQGYTWSVAVGQLPSGLTLSAAGVLSGTLSNSASTSTFTVQVQDSGGNMAPQQFTIAVSSQLTISTASLPNGTAGAPYTSTALAAAGGTGQGYTWSVTVGQLPSGLTLSAAGVLSGTLASSAANSTFTVQVQDSGGNKATQQFTIAFGLIINTDAPLFSGTVGVAYSQPFSASGGKPPYTWSISSGAAGGLILDASTGTLHGTPQNAGTFTITVRVADSAGTTASRTFSVTVTSPVLTIAISSALPTGVVGTAYSQKAPVVATGGTPPYQWGISGGSVAPGLYLNSDTLTIYGTPTAAGTFTFSLQLSDANGQNTTRSLSITVAPASLSITTLRQLPNGTLNTSYSASLAAVGGVPPYTWSAAGLPNGLQIDSAAGTITGVPSLAGTFPVALTVGDGALNHLSDRFTLTITLPTVAPVLLTGLPDTADPAGQYPIQITLASSFPAPITGQAILTFSPDVGPTDQTVQFASGGTTAVFSIPAGTTAAISDVPLAIQTGTVSGTVSISIRLTAGGIDITPVPAPAMTTQIARGAPGINSVSVSRSDGKLTLAISGYSTAREVTQAIFTFSAANGQTLQSAASSLTVSVEALFGTWFQSPANGAYGSQFVFTQPFTIQGDSTAVTPQSVTLVNRVGSTTYPIP